jgi:HEAT repeat protein
MAALTEAENMRAIPVLLEALDDTDQYVRSYVTSLLASLTGQPFGADATQWRAWWTRESAKSTGAWTGWRMRSSDLLLMRAAVRP